jgi:prepilin-type N-terminal cleavage/methylation domain-containing protein
MKKRGKLGSPLRGEGGFTLIEVIVAISILTIGLLAVAAMQSSAIRGNNMGYRVTESTTLAQDRLEWLMMQDYTDAALNAGTGKTDPVGGAPAGYQINYDVADLGGFSGKLITVTVRLREGVVTRVTELQSVRPELL